MTKFDYDLHSLIVVRDLHYLSYCAKVGGFVCQEQEDLAARGLE